MTIIKYGVDHAEVQRLLDSGECQTEEEAIEKVAQQQARLVDPNSPDGPPVPGEPHNIERARLDALNKKREGRDG